jgi:hypothetical protein
MKLGAAERDGSTVPATAPTAIGLSSAGTGLGRGAAAARGIMPDAAAADADG